MDNLQVDIKLTVVLVYALQSLFAVLPPFLFAAIAAALLSLVADLEVGEMRVSILSGFVFGSLGVLFSLFTIVGQDGIISSLVPQIIVAVVFIAQLVGRLNPRLKVPLEAKISLVGAVSAALSYSFGLFYFLYVFGKTLGSGG